MYTEVLKLLRMLKVPVHLSAREGQTAGGMETQIIDNSSRIIKMMIVATSNGMEEVCMCVCVLIIMAFTSGVHHCCWAQHTLV